MLRQAKSTYYLWLPGCWGRTKFNYKNIFPTGKTLEHSLTLWHNRGKWAWVFRQNQLYIYCEDIVKLVIWFSVCKRLDRKWITKHFGIELAGSLCCHCQYNTYFMLLQTITWMETQSFQLISVVHLCFCLLLPHIKFSCHFKHSH